MLSKLIGDKIIKQAQKYVFFHNLINKLFSEELERWQGPPNINNVTQYEIVLSFKVSLFI